LGFSDYTTGRFPANFIHDGSDEVLELFPDSKSGGKNVSDVANANGLYRSGFGGQVQSDMAASSGSAARFFYCAKASKKDRNEGLDHMPARRASAMGYDIGLGEAGEGMFKDRNPQKQNFHPTVKPTDLMRYLCRLITPPNGTVLDPFTGSGSTGKAAVLEGFSFIGVEQSEEYIAIAKARIESATK
jgi:site-specific DNA-methyltransferase (adenine-specific)